MPTLLQGGSSLRVPISYEQYLALGETKHHEYYDELCVVTPPPEGHVLVARRLTRLLHRRSGRFTPVERLAEAGQIVEPFPISLDLSAIFA